MFFCQSKEHECLDFEKAWEYYWAVKAFGLILSVVFLLTFVSSSNARAMTDDTTAASISPTLAVTQVKYELPYPGILPDNPLYKIKAIRDRIIGMLISDPYKKAEFDLLQADKRLHSGMYLVKKNEDELAVSTISKGINYFDEAVSKIQTAAAGGSDTKPLLEKMYSSSKKHKEVFADLARDIDPKYKGQLSGEEKRVEALVKKIEELKKL